MKIQFIIAIIALSLWSCKSDTKSNTPATKTLSITEKIAKAHGYDNWHKVARIDFTFNVDRDSSHYERHWSWRPSESSITMMSNTDTLTYNTTKIDSVSMQADRAFINDKFWLLIPFQLVWDKTITVAEVPDTVAPISKDTLDMITVTYPDKGGYTPGDAYDIYYDSEYLIREWVFRKGNASKPSLTNTFENYKEFNGITLATEHKQANVDWNLNFTNIDVILN
ncbi:MAG: hypothetical protein KJO22_06635 [Bacteroidia bacterium]|nr:hypothetical protein [Bacteroidia bacterium]